MKEHKRLAWRWKQVLGTIGMTVRGEIRVRGKIPCWGCMWLKKLNSGIVGNNQLPFCCELDGPGFNWAPLPICDDRISVSYQGHKYFHILEMARENRREQCKN